jgi:hypothetical protein
VQLLSHWDEILPLLPEDLAEQARQSGALVRRRGIHSAERLLQLILAYAVSDWSLRLVGAWGVLNEVADISDVALLQRLRRSGEWLEGLVAQLLSQPVQASLPAVRLRLVDATSISRPGSQGTDWRVHLCLNLGEMRVDSLTLSDVKGGEGLHHFASAPDEIVVADRAYGYVKSLTQALASGAACVVRVRWKDLATYTCQGRPFRIIDWLRRTFTTSALEESTVELHLTTPQGCFPLRLVACPLPPSEVARAQARVRRQAKKKQTTPSAESLLVAGFVLLVTNLPHQHWSPLQVSDLYRLRWQVELYFKRLKSIMHLDHLRARDPQLARTSILAKLLAALLLERLSHSFLARVPTWSGDLIHPLSTWRLTTLLWQSLQTLFTQHLLRWLYLADPLRLRRYLCNSPRKRPQQEVLARLFVRSLSVVNVLPALS